MAAKGDSCLSLLEYLDITKLSPETTGQYLKYLRT